MSRLLIPNIICTLTTREDRGDFTPSSTREPNGHDTQLFVPSKHDTRPRPWEWGGATDFALTVIEDCRMEHKR